MIGLVSGLALWAIGHFFKRALPDIRARMGQAGKGVATIIIVAGLVLMVLGYRSWSAEIVYVLPDWARHINNLLVYIAVVLFGLGSSKSSLRGKMRHPMLTGVIVWAIAHLLVNGDWASIVLFGGLIVWAVAEMLVINAREPVYHRFEGGSLGGTVRLLLIAAAIYIVLGLIHWWLGYWPFPQ